VSATELIATLARQGVRLKADGDRLRYFPKTIAPELLAMLRRHKAELLAALAAKPEARETDPTDASVVWLATLARLEGNASFPPEIIHALRTATVRWEVAAEPADDAKAAQPASRPRCKRCKSTAYIDVVLKHWPHNGQSIRRDCRHCGFLIGFPLWYGKASDVPV